MLKIFLFLLLSFSPKGSSSVIDEKQLRADLFNNYSKDIIPKQDHSSPINVEMGIAIQTLEEFNQKVENIKLNIWLRMNWNDEFLKWDKNLYGNISFLSVNSNDIWTPDIELYNAASLPELYYLKGGMMLYNSGNILWSRPMIFKLSCSLDLEDFPFDKQTCSMTFGSWIFGDNYLNLTAYEDSSKAIDVLDSFSHSEWDINNITYSRYSTTINNEEKNVIRYDIILERYRHYYLLSMGMTITLVYVSFIIMFLPADNISRTSTAVFIPLTILALQLTIVDKVPVVGYYTLMDKFFLACFILSMIVSMESGLIYSLLVSRPKWLYNFIAKKLNIEEEETEEDDSKSEDSFNMVSEHLQETSIENGIRTKSYSNAIKPEIKNEKDSDLRQRKVNIDLEPGDDIIKSNVIKTIDYNDKLLYLTPVQRKINTLVNSKILFIDNIVRFSLPFIYTIYICVLLI